MKKLLVLAVACLVAHPAFAADLKWYGEVGTRYSQKKFDDGMTGLNKWSGYDTSKETTKAHAIRARLGVTGGKDHIDYGIGVHLNNTAVGSDTGVNSDYVNYKSNGGDLGVEAELAYFRYSNDYGFGDLSVTVGRGNNVFAYDTFGQTLFDTDATFNGFGWKWKWGSFGLNASQYLLGGRTHSRTTLGDTSTVSNEATQSSANPSGWGMLMGYQPTFTWRFTDEIESMFAVGYYLWTGTGTNAAAFGNTLHGGGRAVSSINGIAVPQYAESAYIVSNPKQWQFLVDTSLPFNLNFTGEYVMNKKQYYDEFGSTTAAISSTTGKTKEVKRTAYSAGLVWGHLAKAHDFKVGYAYGSKGLGAVANYYSNDLFAADQKGHTLMADFMATDTLTIGAKALLLKEISKKDFNGNAEGDATTSSVYGSRSVKNNYWQLTANVAF